MSIETYELANAVLKHKTLHPLKPEAKGASPTRVLLLSKSMKCAVIDGPWKDKSLKDRLAGTLRADLDRFVSGTLLRVSLGGRKPTGEDMKRLQDANEVWEFKSDTTPKQGIRVFGRFAGHDEFVATHWQWRDALGNYGSDEWDKEINRCTTEWFKIFQNRAAHTGDSIDAYLSNAKDITIYY